MTDSQTDRIEKSVVLKAPVARVWRALTDAGEFGEWFGVKLRGTFAAGTQLRGSVTHPGYENVTFEITIDQMEPERLLSWRWHPDAVDPAVDYSTEPMTTVVFRLEEIPDGTRLTVTETGFDQLWPWRVQQAHQDNEGGWQYQMESIRGYLDRTA